MKFLFVLLIIMFTGYFLLLYLKKKFRNFLSGNFLNINKMKEEPKNENIIYKKEDVIVLKGDAKDE
jgi:hypothetical protein